MKIINRRIRFRHSIYQYSLILFFILTTFACNLERQDSTAKVIIKVSKKCGGILKLNNYTDSTVYIKLETVNDALIHNINRVNVFDNKIFIHDSGSGSILVFEMNGKFKYKIHNIGSGPHEYIQLSNFFIDRTNKLVLIHDLARNKILKYNTDDGTFKSIINIPDRNNFARDISVMNNGDFLCYTSSKDRDGMCGIWITDKNGIFKKKLWTETELYPFILADPKPVLISQLNDSLNSIFDVINNIVYHYDGSNLTKAYKFDFSELSFTTVSMYPGLSNVKRTQRGLKNIVQTVYSHETKNYIYSSWSIDSKGFNTFYIKKEHKLIILTGYETTDRVLGLDVPIDNPDILCFKIAASECNYILKIPTIGEKIKKILQNTKAEDNPILQLYYMKK